MVHISDKWIKIATFNIRYAPLSRSSDISGAQIRFSSDGEAPWARRLPFIVDQINWESPDIIGFQEVLEHQYHDIKEQEVLKRYNSVGVGRDDGITRGEYVPLFWRSDKFKALSVKHFWLSEEPDVPGTIGWDAGQTRMVTLVHLQPILSGVNQDENRNESFFAMNSHFDDRGLKARTESAKLILRRSNELVNETGLPVLLMGDFNAPIQEAAYKVFTGKTSDQASLQTTDQSPTGFVTPTHGTSSDIRGEASGRRSTANAVGQALARPALQFFKDCGAEVKRPYGAFLATFTGFQNDPRVAQVIDFIMFMSSPPDFWQVIKYGVIPNQFQNEPLASDHRMVSAVIQIN
ncbi:hypothetical protein MJO28_017109 [Puccinia striiformis f. sp. tritici]|uniref:Endonuclease/exonuclease/phosphatase domain-containing protein n=1 Tax=Puccinia striiformis TaxID=27350 RepID=A0A2S4UJ77_9BASI|nr:hypothetical protein Pst134EA_005591 [Puccinia striiformis f. sp. tritici]KAH9471712.1 hypothetical protein Pst134EA_005591 [Puccinia striiformis f. sp. tritici]KAI7934392.1 hypothetical protein MJO28_017109 [Puccinia striiformis f. sp. tritici]KAI7964423.1 hypothetical protein MJO29_002521 [Puccinia striiformis f. sp. tritici]POV97286.1 hypothetical protein PSTT_15141 [Puccinia striiformis]